MAVVPATEVSDATAGEPVESLLPPAYRLTPGYEDLGDNMLYPDWYSMRRSCSAAAAVRPD